MLDTILRKLFGSANDRFLKKTTKFVERINALESEYAALSDEALQHKTQEFRDRLAQGATLDDVLVEAFAVVREAGKRVYGMRLFDVQLVGGYVLHKGMIAEMKTGEGKTFVATIAVYLNALTKEGVHVVTVNDYLAKRDSGWGARLYNFLGLTVGCIVHGLTDQQRRAAYACDVTYGTNHEFGFDYLRDNMKFRLGELVQRPFNFAIVDEADSILIDEARTPLIISGAAEDSSELYQKIDKVIRHLQEGDFEKDEKQKNVMLTESGIERLEGLLTQDGTLKGASLYDVQNVSLVHHITSALRAHHMFARDVDYIVKDGKVVIIDEFTGRMMDGRRYSDGLHQALEAKEGVEVEMENQTLASITYQNYFRLYKKLACMTGTAMTEATEFEEIYKLNVISIPTNVAVARVDHDDDVYLTAKEKYTAVLNLVKECMERRQPVLVGTVSIEKSELVSKILKDARIPHQVLNARHHEQESLIISQAGCPGAVTIATNMAGRGTDIKLGGNLDMRLEQELSNIADEKLREERAEEIRAQHRIDEETVKKAGGLFVIGTERHESRRIDNQLRGRSGRQGDPGASKFYVSLEDDLMRIFGSDRLDAMLRKLGVQEGEAISHSWISKALQRAQQKVEARNFDIRKHLLKYDDVMSDQRKIVYGQRLDIMKSSDISEMIETMRHDVVDDIVNDAIPENSLQEQWDLAQLELQVERLFGLKLPLRTWGEEDGASETEIREKIRDAVDHLYAEKEKEAGADTMRHTEQSVMLRTLDSVWKEHLLVLDHLRQGINLRAYAQSNPLNEYKREAFNLFHVMLRHLREDTISTLMRFDASHIAPSNLANLLTPDMDLSALAELLPNWMMNDEEAEVEDAAPAEVSLLDRLTEMPASANAHEKKDAQPTAPKTKESSASTPRKSAPLKAANAPASEKSVTKKSAKGTASEEAVQKKTTVKASAAKPASSAKVTKAAASVKDTAPKKSSKKAAESLPPQALGDAPIQRNADCPCGSGKKYKHCHGALA